MVNRRQFITGLGTFTAGSLLASEAGSSTIVSALVSQSNTIVVGAGGDYSQVSDALADITDASSDNPYLIQVLAGVYDLNWKAKPWVTVLGSGPLSTIFEGEGSNRILMLGSNIYLGDFAVRYRGLTDSHAAIQRYGRASGIILNNIHIEHHGQGAAIKNINGGTLLTWWLQNLKIRSEGTALLLGGHTYCDNLKVMLFGNNSGHEHVGCKVIGNSARIYLNNCRIGTGYWYDYTGTEYIENSVSGPDNVIGVWIPPGTTNQRVEIHNLESFCRNEDFAPPDIDVNVIRAETGWVRAFGCFGQSETPSNWSDRKSLFQSGDGKIEVFGSRFTNIDGESYGSEQLQIQTYTVADDGKEIEKFEGGLHRLDSSAGNFRIYMPWPDFTIPGVVHVFKKVNDANSVEVYFQGPGLEGNAGPLSLTNRYETLRITWDGTEWVRV